MKKDYEITFGNHLQCKLTVSDNGIEVVAAMKGWGNNVPNDQIKIELLPSAPNEENTQP